MACPGGDEVRDPSSGLGLVLGRGRRLFERMVRWPRRAPSPARRVVEAPGSQGEDHAPVGSLAPVTAEQYPLVAIQPGGSRLPFFMVHPIGGYVLCYVPLARHLDPYRPIYGLAAPGLVDERDRGGSVEEMAARYVAAVRRIQPGGPYMVGGYSFGCYVAFEMAQQLRRAGERTALLALLDAWAPGSEGGGRWSPDVRDSVLATRLLQQYAHACGRELTLASDALHRCRTEDEALAYLLTQAKAAVLVTEDVDLRWVRRFLRGFKTRLEVAAKYVPHVYPGSITLFRSAENGDELDGRSEVGAGADPSKGWARLSTEPVEILAVPGHHETLLGEPHVRVLARLLGESLDRAEAGLAARHERGASARVGL
jgi:thioesterase domain-containing protein